MLAIDGLNKFVTAELTNYKKKLADWKKTIGKDPDLGNPYMLAAMLITHLKMYDSKLASVMRGIFKDDNKLIDQHYELVARYFVDEAG